MNSNSNPEVSAQEINSLINYQKGAVVSRTIIKKPKGTVTLFAFDEGEELSEHTSPYEAMVQILDGSAEIKISGETYNVSAGEYIMLPADEPHALFAREQFKMLLTMVRE